MDGYGFAMMSMEILSGTFEFQPFRSGPPPRHRTGLGDGVGGIWGGSAEFQKRSSRFPGVTPCHPGFIPGSSLCRMRGAGSRHRAGRTYWMSGSRFLREFRVRRSHFALFCDTLAGLSRDAYSRRTAQSFIGGFCHEDLTSPPAAQRRPSARVTRRRHSLPSGAWG